MEIKLREALINDFNQVNQIFSYTHDIHVKERPDVFKESINFFLIDEFEKNIKNENKKIIVALINEEIVGACMFEIIKIAENNLMYKRNVILIEILGTLPQFQKKGIGSLFIDYLKKYREDHNISTIQLTTWDFNKNALRFYEKHNFLKRNYRLELK